MMYTVRDSYGVWHLVGFLGAEATRPCVVCNRFRGQEADDALNTRLKLRSAFPPTCLECLRGFR